MAKGCNIKYTVQFVKEYLFKRNIELLSDTYESNRKKLKCRCLKCGCIWFPCFTHIKNCNSGCIKCSGRMRYSYEYVKKYCLSKNIKLIEKEYINNRTTLECQCIKCNHIWFIRFDDIKNGNKGCPICNQPGIRQQYLYKILKEIYPNYEIYYNFRKFEWLRNKRKMEIDIWIPDLKLAIEYQGEQHYKPNRYIKNKQIKEKKFKEIQYRDMIKNKLIQEHKEEINFFIEFKYTEKIDREYVENKLKELKIL